MTCAYSAALIGVFLVYVSPFLHFLKILFSLLVTMVISRWALSGMLIQFRIQ